MKRGRCQGCGKRELLISFRGNRCLSCICMASEYRGDERDFDQDVEADEKLDPAPSAARTTGKGARLAPRGRMTDINVKLAATMHADGMTLRMIARELGVSKTSVFNSIRRMAG